MAKWRSPLVAISGNTDIATDTERAPLLRSHTENPLLL